jgi:hypothetical protein
MTHFFLLLLSSALVSTLFIYVIIMDYIIKKYIFKVIARYYPSEIEKIIITVKRLHLSNKIVYEDKSILKFESDDYISIKDRKKIKTYRVVKKYLLLSIVVELIAWTLCRIIFL